MMANWETVSELATAGGTLVLAVATFVSVRQGQRATRISERAARIAEQSLLAAQRPLLVNSRLQDPKQRVSFREGEYLDILGGRAAIKITDDAVYMALSIRNVGTGLAVLHGWCMRVGPQRDRVRPSLEDFITQQLDIYLAAGEFGFWEGAFRGADTDEYKNMVAGVAGNEMLMLSLLYGDFEGGQRVISQFNLRPQDDMWFAGVIRHFNVDRPDPR
jgi:hypothetical protein